MILKRINQRGAFVILMQGKTSVSGRDKNKLQRDHQTLKAEERLSKMSEDEVLAWLKQKGLATFGTKGERLERAKKAMNIPSSNEGGKNNFLREIERIKQKREDRRAEINQIRKDRLENQTENEKLGRKGDVDFARMIEACKHGVSKLADHVPSTAMKLCICVRKRPIFPKELLEGENDCLSVANPEVRVFDCKLRVDGITKYIDTQTFNFDNAFNEFEDTEAIYESSVRPVMEEIFQEGRVTLCAYGQTGSGKTFTMKSLQEIAVEQLFFLAETQYPGTKISVSFFEIYGGRCFDLMNDKAKVQILEDRNNNVVIQGLSEREVSSRSALLSALEFAFEQRTTYATCANDTSSRSHAVCQITLRRDGGLGKLVVVDLAGSERAQDTTSNDRQRRLEGAEINKSLLALKECIRAMDAGSAHVPFRVSKLTMALRDSFAPKTSKNRVVMIACVCPNSSSADHTLNTLRYADRLKGKKIHGALGSAVSFPLDAPRPPTSSLYSKELLDIQEQFREFNFALDSEPLKEPLPPSARSKPKQEPVLLVKPTTNPPPPESKARGLFPLQNKNSKPTEKIQKHSENELQKSPRPELLVRQPNEAKKLYRQDLNFMRQTINEQADSQSQIDSQEIDTDEYLTFHDKVGDIIEIHDELISLHLNVIREDAQLLSVESEIIAEAQHQAENDVERYVNELEDIVKKKLYLYKQVEEKIKKFHSALKEEEDFSKRLKSPVYY